MFSATKLVAGAAVLALAGGLLYSGVLTVEPEGPVPASAEAERTDFILVTGTSTLPGGAAPDGVDTMSDPRVSGPLRLTNRYVHGSEDSTGVQWGEYTLTNEDGGWEGEWVGLWDPYGPDYPDVVGMENAMAWARGTGDYEGWSYVANYTGALDSLDVRGLLYQGDIPPTVALGLAEAEAEAE